MALEDEIFSISSESDFKRVAMEVFRFQSNECNVYRDFLQTLGHKNPQTIEEIPFLPISFFKTHDVISNSKQAELIFLSSGTGNGKRSKHLVGKKEMYYRSFTKTYFDFIGNPEEQVILALLPNYLEQGDSSLVCMVDHLMKLTKSSFSNYLLNDLNAVEKTYSEALKSLKKVVIFGVSYALLDLAEKKVNLSEALIIETGGMKGKRKELTKDELHNILKSGLNVPYISSEYGMTELLSQAYSDKDGLFKTSPWLRILIRDVNDPLSLVQNGKTGGINVIDLANLFGCSFISTQDLGKIEGDSFRVMGRFDNSEIRGCNLMLD
jgi:hypothetical protein